MCTISAWGATFQILLSQNFSFIHRFDHIYLLAFVSTVTPHDVFFFLVIPWPKPKIKNEWDWICLNPRPLPSSPIITFPPPFPPSNPLCKVRRITRGLFGVFERGRDSGWCNPYFYRLLQFALETPYSISYMIVCVAQWTAGYLSTEIFDLIFSYDIYQKCNIISAPINFWTHFNSLVITLSQEGVGNFFVRSPWYLENVEILIPNPNSAKLSLCPRTSKSSR